ncbi:MAG TPA: hypothetical protein VKV77_09215 [Methylovirgula sp.]|nr:hypothetical protein [Methylovirgula sp.]
MLGFDMEIMSLSRRLRRAGKIAQMRFDGGERPAKSRGESFRLALATLELGRGVGELKGANRAGRAFQPMQETGLSDTNPPDLRHKFGRLSDKQVEEFALQARIGARLLGEMEDIEDITAKVDRALGGAPGGRSFGGWGRGGRGLISGRSHVPCAFVGYGRLFPCYCTIFAWITGRCAGDRTGEKLFPIMVKAPLTTNQKLAGPAVSIPKAQM